MPKIDWKGRGCYWFKKGLGYEFCYMEIIQSLRVMPSSSSRAYESYPHSPNVP